MEFDYDWSKTTVAIDGLAQLVNNPFLSDLRFEFPDGRLLFGHRTIVCMRSQKLHEIFNSKILINMLNITDFSFEVYKEFLNYLYTDDCDINLKSAVELLQLASDQNMDGLIQKCKVFLMQESTNPLYLFDLNFDNSWPEKESHALKYIAYNFIEVLSSPEFLKIKPETLTLILKLDAVSAPNEYDIFDAVMKWVRSICDKNNEHDNGYIKRRILGDNLFLIRFPAMNYEEFGKCVDREPDLLNSDEMSAIFLNIVNKKKNNLGFSDVERIPLLDDKHYQLNEEHSSLEILSSSQSKHSSSSINSNEFESTVIENTNLTVSNVICNSVTTTCTDVAIISETSKDVVKESYAYQDKSKFLSIFLDFEITVIKKWFHWNAFFMHFTVSKPIILAGVYCYGSSKRLIQFKILNSKRRELMTCESNGNDPFTLFQPTHLKPNDNYSIMYSFIDVQDEESIQWKCRQYVPWSIEQNGIIFKFTKMSAHIARLYYIPDTLCTNESLIESSNQLSYAPSNYNRRPPYNKPHYKGDNPKSDNIMQLPLASSRVFTDKLKFTLDFSVSHAIVLTAILLSKKIGRKVQITVIDRDNKEIERTNYVTDHKIMFNNKLLLQPNQRYKVIYTFMKESTGEKQLQILQCTKRTPWHHEVMGTNVTFTFYENSPHITQIFFQ